MCVVASMCRISYCNADGRPYESPQFCPLSLFLLRNYSLLSYNLMSISTIIIIMSNSSGKITCYSYTGVGYTNNTKCPQNDSCCQTAAQCRDDRLCVANGGEDGIYVRATCVNRPWTLATCAQICLYGMSVFESLNPRVSDGHR